jgi:hypothetical protein
MSSWSDRRETCSVRAWFEGAAVRARSAERATTVGTVCAAEDAIG